MWKKKLVTEEGGDRSLEKVLKVGAVPCELAVKGGPGAVEKKPAEGGQTREPDGNFPLKTARAQRTQEESLEALCG